MNFCHVDKSGFLYEIDSVIKNINQVEGMDYSENQENRN
jgi:hypothetical protein